MNTQRLTIVVNMDIATTNEVGNLFIALSSHTSNVIIQTHSIIITDSNGDNPASILTIVISGTGETVHKDIISNLSFLTTPTPAIKWSEDITDITRLVRACYAVLA